MLAIHSSICKFLHANPDVALAGSELKAAINSMREYSIDNIKSHGLNRIKKNREIAKLLMLEYYSDLMHKSKTYKDLHDQFLVRYTMCFLICCRSHFK